MQIANTTAAFSLVFALAGTAAASPGPCAHTVQHNWTVASETVSISGSIKSVADDFSTFVVEGADGKETTITVTDETSYLLDGKAAKHDEVLKSGLSVTVKHDSGTAKRVSATSK